MRDACYIQSSFVSHAEHRSPQRHPLVYHRRLARPCSRQPRLSCLMRRMTPHAPTQAGEAGLGGPAAAAGARALLTLRFALAEGRALALLAATDLRGAQRVILGAQRLHAGFPGALGSAGPSLLMLAGAQGPERCVPLWECMRGDG